MWFASQQRPLPWRETYAPYQVWVSEIMLQQTQVKTALPYFDRWMKTLPSIKDVAAASEDTILKLWEGLGYYSRARNLQKAAIVIMDEFGGVFPQDHESIHKLPGIGPYTAGAICSIAFNQEHPIVDGNIIRLIARLLNDSDNTRLPKNVKKYWQRSEQLIPLGKAREFNQSMMEFGALMCTPKKTKCGECPLQSVCESYSEGTVESIPNRGKATEKVSLQVSLAVIKKSNKFFIQKREKGGLMGGLWEFPGGKIEKGETPKEAIHREIGEELGVSIKNLKSVMKIKHAYTKYLVDLHCFTADIGEGDIRLAAATEHKWVELGKLENYPFPAANVKLIRELVKQSSEVK